MARKIARQFDDFGQVPPPAHVRSVAAANGYLAEKLGQQRRDAINRAITLKSVDVMGAYYDARKAEVAAILRKMAGPMRSLRAYRPPLHGAIARMLHAYREAVDAAQLAKGKRVDAKARVHAVAITAAPGGGFLVRELGSPSKRKPARGDRPRERAPRWLSQRDMMNAVLEEEPQLAGGKNAALFATLAISVLVDDVPSTPPEWDNARATWRELLKTARRGGKRARK